MSDPIFFIQAQFDTLHGLIALQEEGDVAVLVRDKSSSVQIVLERVKGSLFPNVVGKNELVPEYALVAQNWESPNLFLCVNNVYYSRGPVVLQNLDILELRNGNELNSLYRYEVVSCEEFKRRTRTENSLEQLTDKEHALKILKEQEALLLAQQRLNEVVKWSNYYSYQYNLPEYTRNDPHPQSILYHHDSTANAISPSRMIISHLNIPQDILADALSSRLLRLDEPSYNGTEQQHFKKNRAKNADETIQLLRKQAYYLFPEPVAKEIVDDNQETENNQTSECVPVHEGEGENVGDLEISEECSPWEMYHDHRSDFVEYQNRMMHAEQEESDDNDNLEEIKRLRIVLERIKTLENFVSQPMYF